MNGCPDLLPALDLTLLQGLRRMHIDGSGLGWWMTALPENFAKLSTLRFLSRLALSNYPLKEVQQGPGAHPKSTDDALRYVWPCISLRYLRVRDAEGIAIKPSIAKLTQLQVIGPWVDGRACTR
jgi:hypothetical protein